MSEFESRDPQRELQERARRIVEQLNGAQDATRAELRARTAESQSDAWAEHEAVVERIPEDPEVSARREREKARCTSCLEAIVAKLAAQGTPLPRDMQQIVLFVMEQVPGEWREYDGEDDGVALGKVTFDEMGVTVSFVSYGFEVGRRTIPFIE